MFSRHDVAPDFLPRGNEPCHDDASGWLAGTPLRRCGGRAFTLLEITVALIVVAILAGLIVPRLAGNQTRQFRATVDKIADLLTMYGQRQNLSQKIVGIAHDRDENSIALMEIDVSNPDLGGQWRLDPFVRPVRLPLFMTDTDIEFYIDGDPCDPSEWPLSSEPGQQRPSVEIHMRGPDGAGATLILSSYSVSPTIIDGIHSSGTSRTEVDLDAAGRGREDW
jgi:prepilin-type N-terminal cleavage/methylation domain-containing protein